MVERFRANIRLKKVLFEDEGCFYSITGVKENNRFFYNKSQQHILDNFLDVIAERYNKREVIYNNSRCEIASQFNAIRLVDPESFHNKYNGNQLYSLCSLIWPSTKVIVTRRKTIVPKIKSGFIGIPQLTYLKNRDKVLTQK